MGDPATSISPDERIWIYQSNRKFTKKEKRSIIEESSIFIRNWASHGNKLNASVEIFYDCFLVLSVNENEFIASGCSIDKSIQFIKILEQAYNLSLLDRNNIAYWVNGHVEIEPVLTFKNQIKLGKITGDTVIFNNLVNFKSQMETNWKVPVKESWLKKYLPEKQL